MLAATCILVLLSIASYEAYSSDYNRDFLLNQLHNYENSKPSSNLPSPREPYDFFLPSRQYGMSKRLHSFSSQNNEIRNRPNNFDNLIVGGSFGRTARRENTFIVPEMVDFGIPMHSKSLSRPSLNDRDARSSIFDSMTPGGPFGRSARAPKNRMSFDSLSLGGSFGRSMRSRRPTNPFDSLSFGGGFGRSTRQQIHDDYPPELHLQEFDGKPDNTDIEMRNVDANKENASDADSDGEEKPQQRGTPAPPELVYVAQPLDKPNRKLFPNYVLEQ